MRGRTVILVSHHVQLCAPGASYIVALDNGRVQFSGDRDAFKSSGVMAKLVQSTNEHTDEEMKKRKLSLRTCRRWTKKTHCRWWQMVLTQALLSLLPLPWNRRWLENHPGNWSKKRHVPLDVSVLIYGRRIYGLVEMAGTGLCSSVYWLLRR